MIAPVFDSLSYALISACTLFLLAGGGQGGNISEQAMMFSLSDS